VLIDGDLRKPSVESVLMGKDLETPGVTDYLTGKKSFEEVVQSCRLPGLFFISGGTIAPNPAELLAKDGLGELIERALKLMTAWLSIRLPSTPSATLSSC